MIIEDYEKFSVLLADVHGFYQRDVSEFGFSVWWASMKPFDFSAVSQALNRHVMNPDSGQFMPKPADIVRMLQGSTQDSALVAWSKVNKAVRQVGNYESVAFDDALIHRVLHEMGGWISLGQKTEDDWPFVAKEFENRYRGYKSRNEVPDYPPVLAGLAEAQNSQQGFQSAKPILIGNADAARRVMDRGTNAPLIGFQRADISTERVALRIVSKLEDAA